MATLNRDQILALHQLIDKVADVTPSSKDASIPSNVFRTLGAFQARQFGNFETGSLAIPGLERVFSRLVGSLFFEPIVTSLRTTVNANSTATLTIQSANKQWRIIDRDSFGNVNSNVFDFSCEYDDIHSFGPVRATVDITSATDLPYVEFMGPIRTRTIYTFLNTASGTETLQFTSWSHNVPEFIAQTIMRFIYNDLQAAGVSLTEGVFSDSIRRS